MILRTNKLQFAALLLHMSIMRKNIKKGFKSSYGAKEGKEILQSFDEVKDDLKIAFEEMEEAEGSQERDFHFNIKHVNMLSSFLTFYTKELQTTLEGAKSKHSEDWEQLDYLKEINKKIEQVVLNHA